MYFIIDKRTGNILSRNTNVGFREKAVTSAEVPHDEYGLVNMLDVLLVMGYKIDKNEIAIKPKTCLMSRESRYQINDLRMIHLSPETGLIK